MASTVLGIAGSAVPGAGFILGPLGAILGSVIDQKLFADNKKTGGADAPKVGDIALGRSQEGAPIPWTVSNKFRVPGALIALSDLIVEESEEEVGGKLGNDKITTRHYFAHVAFAISGREIDSVKQIWANGRLIYKFDNEITISSNLISAFKREENCRNDLETGLRVCDDIYLDLESPSGSDDLTVFHSGVPLTVSGFTGAASANNGTFIVASKRTLEDGDTVVRLYHEGAVDAPAGDTVTLFQDPPDFSSATADDIRIYTGSETQTIDATLSSLVELPNVPAFRGIAYVVIEKLSLDAFGGVMPQFSAQVNSSATISSNADIITDLVVNRAGVDSSLIDVSGLDVTTGLDQTRGLEVPVPGDTLEALRPLLMTGFIHASEQNGKIVFFKRDNAGTKTVTDGDLAAHEFGQDAPRTAVKKDPDPDVIPAQCNVKYLDTASGMQPGSQTERAFGATGDHVMSIDLPVVLAGSQARFIARRSIWDARVESRKVEFQLPPSYIDVVAGDKVTITDEGQLVDVVVTEIERGANFITICKGYIQETQTLEDGVADDPNHDPEEDDDPPFAPSMLLSVLDIPALEDSQTTSTGYFLVTALNEKTADFGGGSVFQSLDDVTYNELLQVENETTMGSATDTLGDASGNYWDETNSVNVRLVHGTLASKTRIEVLNGSNRALLGNEIIGFRSATLESDGTYTLAGLLRGRRDTSEFTGSHGDGDVFVLLSTPVHFQTLNVGQVGVNRFWKAVANGGSLDDSDAVSLAPTARNVAPFAPMDLTGTRNGSDDDILIAWKRRSRAETRFFAFGSAPLLEPSEEYEIDIYSDDTFTTIIGTHTVTGATTFNYTEALQNGDGHTLGDPVHLEIFQISDTIGRGNERRATV